jgi:hypothetical protein
MWTIKNLAFTRDDPNRRYLKSPLARRGRVVIGARKVPAGRTITISDAIYEKYARRINAYEACGLIKTKRQISDIPVVPITVEPDEVVEVAPVEVEVAPVEVAEESVEVAPDPVPEDKTPEDPKPEPEPDPEPEVEAKPEPKKKMEPKSKRRRTRAPKES